MGVSEGDEGKGENKSPGQLLSDRLFNNRKNSWENAEEGADERIGSFAEDYKAFLSQGKTERECTALVREALEGAGFRDLLPLLEGAGPAGANPLRAGDRVFLVNRDKSLAAAVIGGDAPRGGVNIVGAHLDSPRIDLKANPLYEDAEFALLDTQYYGGIKNYQWTAIPLALHGVMIRGDGSRAVIRLGEEGEDPVFTITDLLPHLAREQMQKKASEAVAGEDLNILAGSRPYLDAKVKEKVKLNLLDILNRDYGIVEQDFFGAELELVPAFRARDLGFDRSMIGGYGHDDRSCAYAAVRALLDVASGPAPRRTAVAVLTDKEETGSAGNTGAQSRFFENFIAYLLSLTSGGYSEIELRECLDRSSMLSGDVTSALDPTYDSAWDKKNAACLGRGIAFAKFSGGSGKSGGSDANAEFCGKVQRIFTRGRIDWQYGDMGKVDKGGGGTIAKYMANLGVEVLDCGIPVLSMHSPFEVISKIDLYTTFRAYGAFYREA